MSYYNNVLFAYYEQDLEEDYLEYLNGKTETINGQRTDGIVARCNRTSTRKNDKEYKKRNY